MAEDDTPEHAIRLEACKRAEDRGGDWAGRVLSRWIDGEKGDGIPGVEIVTTDEQGCCLDCGTRGTLYYWRRPLVSGICSWCSLSRFTNGGRNERTDASLTGRSDVHPQRHGGMT